MEGRSGGGRGTVLDGRQRGKIEGGCGRKAHDGLVQTAKGEAGKDGLWRRRIPREDGVVMRVVVIAPRAAIDLGGILRRHQVIGHGDGRQQNEKQQAQGNHLPATLGPVARRLAQPEPYHGYGQQEPDEVESELHEHADSTPAVNMR
jgi:hypothetical protein